MSTTPSCVRPRDALITAFQIGFAYLAVGGLWIWLSDALVARISTEAAWLVAAQQYKGFVYILLTTAGLVFLVYRSHVRLMASQEDVARSQLRVADLFERHPQPMWIQDASTCRFLRVNDAAVQTYGYSRAEFLCLATRDIWPEADVASFPGEFDNPTLGALARGVSRHRTKDGRVILARLTEHHLELDGRPALMVMAEDVTREGLIVEGLQRLQQQQQQLKQRLGIVLWIGSADRSQLSYVSQSLFELAGVQPAYLRVDPSAWRRLVHPYDQQRVPGLLDTMPCDDGTAAKSSARSLSHRLIYRIERRDGRVVWVEDRRCSLPDAAGQLTLIGGALQDISDQREEPRLT